MIRKFMLLSSLAALTLTGCATGVPLHSDAKNIQVVTSFTPGPQCQLMGNVIVQTTSTYSKDSSSLSSDEINSLKNEALNLNANIVAVPRMGTIYFEDTKKNLRVIVGTAYRC